MAVARSASFSPSVSHWPRRRANGAYCMRTDITCFPGGARSGSTMVGTVTSRNGAVEGFPYFASSYALSMYSSDGHTRKCGGIPSSLGDHRGAPSRAKLTFATTPFISKFLTWFRNSGPSSSGSTRCRKVRFGSAFEATTRAWTVSPPSTSTPVTRPSALTMRVTSASVRIVAPASRAAWPSASASAPMPPRTNADAVPWTSGRIQRAGELAQEFDESRIRVRVFRRKRSDGLLGLLDVSPDREGPAVAERNDRWVRLDESDSARGQVQILHDLGSQQAADRRSGGSAETRSNLFRRRRAANRSAFFEDEHAASGAREVRGRHEAVVATAHDHDVIRLGQRSHPQEGPVFQDFSRRVHPGRAHHAAPRVSAGAAEVQPLQRHAVLGPSGRRTEEEQLVRGELSVEDVPPRQADHLLEVPRAQHLPVEDDLSEVRDILLEGVEDRVPECLAPFLPRALPQRVRGILDETRHEVFPRWRQGRVERRRDAHVDVRSV